MITLSSVPSPSFAAADAFDSSVFRDVKSENVEYSFSRMIPANVSTASPTVL
jgi:hypothetical protein